MQRTDQPDTSRPRFAEQLSVSASTVVLKRIVSSAWGFSRKSRLSNGPPLSRTSAPKEVVAIGAGLLWLTGLLFLLALPLESAAQNEARGVIAYTSLRPPNQDIYLIRGPDAVPERLTDHPGLDYNVTFSPDGRWLVYTSERAGNTDLYALDLEDTSDPTRLTHSPAFDGAADISPDGNRLAFVSTREGTADIFVMPFAPGDTTAEQEAEKLTNHPSGAFRPAFSPDGSAIAFSRQTIRTFRPAQFRITELVLMDADGSRERHLVGGDSTSAGSPAWSKDGETIYFHSLPTDGLLSGGQLVNQIKRVDLEGTRPTPVTPQGARTDLMPSAGPDGRLLFYRGPPGPPGRGPLLETGWIYSTASDGSGLRLEVDSTQIGACMSPSAGADGLIACHGPGPTSDLSVMRSSEEAFLRPGSHHTATLPDRSVDLVGVWGLFPDHLPEERVAYTAGGFFGSPIVTSRLDGSERQVVHDPESRFAWATSTCSRDEWIAFNVGPGFAPVGAPVDIWKVRADGSGLMNLTADSTTNDAFPTWSSDCEQIVFRSGRDGNKEIYLMDAGGSDQRRLTHHDSTDTAPALSPDGRWVAYSTTRGGPGYRLRIQRLDGSEGRFLEPDRVGEPGRDMHPRFSPDGEWIVFTSSRGGIADEFVLTIHPQPYGDLWAVPVEGGSAIRLTNNKWEDGLPRWGIR